MKKFLLGAAVFAAFSTAAFAADPFTQAPAHDWSGIYAGGVVGYGWADSRHCDGAGCSGNGPSVDSTGITGGVTLGANAQMSNFVLGVEADYMFAAIDGSSPSTVSYGCGTDCETNVDGIGTIRGRLGYAMDSFLPFVSAGMAISDVEASLDGVGSSETFVNFVAGGGLEFAFSEQLSAKVEYLHIFDNGDDFVFRTGCVAPGCAIKEYDADLLRLGVNYHF